jgi:hypothetical protein
VCSGKIVDLRNSNMSEGLLEPPHGGADSPRSGGSPASQRPTSTRGTPSPMSTASNVSGSSFVASPGAPPQDVAQRLLQRLSAGSEFKPKEALISPANLPAVYQALNVVDTAAQVEVLSMLVVSASLSKVRASAVGWCLASTLMFMCFGWKVGMDYCMSMYRAVSAHVTSQCSLFTVNDDATTAVASCERVRGRLRRRQHLMPLTARVHMLACLWALFECASLRCMPSAMSNPPTLAWPTAYQAVRVHCVTAIQWQITGARLQTRASARAHVMLLYACRVAHPYRCFPFVLFVLRRHCMEAMVLPSSMHLLISEATCSCQ